MKYDLKKVAFAMAIAFAWVFDVRADAVIATVPTGNGPSAIALDSVANKIYVANYYDSSITVIDGAANSTSTIKIGFVTTNSSALAVNPVTHKIYVANTSGNSVTVIDGPSNSISTVTVGSAPSAIAVNSVTNKIYVANQNSNNITVINGTNNSTTTVSAGFGPVAIAVNTVTNKIYVSDTSGNSVTVIDGPSNLISTVAVGSAPSAIAVNSVTNKIYVANAGSHSVTVIDGSTNSTSTVNLNGAPSAFAVNAVTNKIYVANSWNFTITVIDGVTNAIRLDSIKSWATAIAINPVTNKIYVSVNNYGNAYGVISIINGTTDVTTNINIYGISCDRLALNSMTNKIYSPCFQCNSVTIIDGTNAPTGIIALVAPADNASNIPINTTLIWNPISGITSYTIHVDTTPIFNSSIIYSTVAGNSLSVSLNNGTKYYWRVAATNSGGIGPWTRDSFFTALVAPILNYPSNNLLNVPLNPSFSWNSSVGATAYRFQLSTASSFSNPAIDASQNSNAFLTASLLPGTLYYWRTYSLNSNETSPWSMIFNFTTIPPPPNPVTLVSPPDNAINVIFNPTLKWTPSLIATGYTVQVSANAAFSSTIINLNILPDTLNVSLSAGTKFYWRVSATNMGGSSLWATDSFKTLSSAPAPPVLTSPLNGAINIPLFSMLSWNSSPGAAIYRVQCSNSTSFVLLTDTMITDTSRAISSLSANTTYYWRVTAGNLYGTSLWSVIDSFSTVGGIPNVPVLVGPPNGSTNIPMNPTLLWNPSSGATAYEVQISNTSSFALAIDTTVSVAQRFIGSLSSYTTYYWRVNASNSYGTSGWTTPYSFATNGIGILDMTPCFKDSYLGYNGTLAVYSLSGRQVLKISFTASFTKKAMLRNVDKIPAKGFYRYQFLKDRKVMDWGNFVVK